MKPTSLFCTTILILVFASSINAQIRRTGEFNFSGTVRSVKPGTLVIQDEDGKAKTYKIQDADEDALALDGGKYIFKMPAKISVAGTMPATLLERGMIVQFDGEINRSGKSKTPVTKMTIVDAEANQLRVTGDTEPRGPDHVACKVTARIVRVIKNKMILQVEKSRINRNERIEFKFTEDATFDISGNNLNRVVPGDKVEAVKGVELSTGDNVISHITVALTAKRKAATTSFHELLEQKHSSLSDEPRGPREERSDHFVLITDLSDRSAAILLDKLETMYELIGRYYGKRPRDIIECWVVRDLRNFDGKLPQIGFAKIAEGAGVTSSVRLGNQVKSIVYSCDKHGVVQHEAVHAFCSQTFGSAGPIWYAEGMAELGQYWKPGELAVDIDPVVIDYLTNAKKKKLLDIVAAGQITGDSWQAYSWRWALCYLLASNPNYQRDFKRLGVAMMQKQDNATFEYAYGNVAKEISFEYDQFVQHFGNGYRADLCAWDWTIKPKNITSSQRVSADVKAAAGLQATQLQVKAGKQYDFIAQGDWTLEEDGVAVSANGNDLGLGRMVAAILSKNDSGDYELSDPFDLGAQGSFTSPGDGQVFVRCDDSWTELGDNSGEIKLYFRLSPK